MTTRVLSSAIALLALVIGAALTLVGCTSAGSTALNPGTVLSGTLNNAAPTTAAVGDPVHIAVPAVGVDASVREIVDTSDEIDPPTNDDAWWWTGRGRPGSADTVYIAGHTLDDGTGVFGPLGGVHPGAEVRLGTTAGDLIYQVDATATYTKSQLEQYDEVWQSIPGRLILVTCHLDADGNPTDDNLLVYASLRG
ncbi:class F sortase [Gordonia sp. NPDC003504]